MRDRYALARALLVFLAVVAATYPPARLLHALEWPTWAVYLALAPIALYAAARRA